MSAMSNPELFQPAEMRSESPKLRWMRTHNIITEFLDAGFGCRWYAHCGEFCTQHGETEDEALTNLAMALGVRRWDEVWE